MIDAATARISEVTSTAPAAAVCPPDMTEAGPRVVELRDRYGQLGIDDVPIASRTCRVLRVSPVLEHGTDREGRPPRRPAPCVHGRRDLSHPRVVAATWLSCRSVGMRTSAKNAREICWDRRRDLGDAGGVGAHDVEAELGSRGPDGSALPA